MKNNIKILVVLAILSINLVVCKSHNVYANNDELNLDLLIKNKEQQEEIKEKIIVIEEQIEDKSKEEEEDKGIEVVSVSFVENVNSEAKLFNVGQVELLKEEKSLLESQLQEEMIEGVKLQKILEQNKEKYLQANNLSFIPGIWPVPSYTEISSPYGERIHPITGELSFHKGIDIPAPQDTDILAVDDGIVTFSGIQNGYGNVVKIKHFDGKETVYAHNNLNLVKKGDIVKQGNSIAKIGSTGDSTGNHVHFETKIEDENKNPINIIQSN